MTIEQAAKQLSEAVKAMCETIKDNDANCISIHSIHGGIRVFVLNKEVFKSINSDHTSMEWHCNSREFVQATKRVGDIEFYALIKANAPAPDIAIPPDVAEKANVLLNR